MNPVHPRACGEHEGLKVGGGYADGSSPRLRGTPGTATVGTRSHRFIPAPAGNTFPRRTARPGRPVHPRACGEHWACLIVVLHCAGSSPRLRGTPAPCLPTRTPARFIPAPAGNTSPPPFISKCETVHPRACGEHSETVTMTDRINGSSPRLRGTRRVKVLRRRGARFIPAPAGNTGAALARSPIAAVHPRACGEHLARQPEAVAVAGSSPRLRGTLSTFSCSEQNRRFIPAPAGNTTTPCAQGISETVLPRACGEHRLIGEIRPRYVGSSPRLRGTP